MQSRAAGNNFAETRGAMTLPDEHTRLYELK
jgi:hypothetical protein